MSPSILITAEILWLLIGSGSFSESPISWPSFFLLSNFLQVTFQDGNVYTFQVTNFFSFYFYSILLAKLLFSCLPRPVEAQFIYLFFWILSFWILQETFPESVLQLVIRAAHLQHSVHSIPLWHLFKCFPINKSILWIFALQQMSGINLWCKHDFKEDKWIMHNDWMS